ncbi:ROK family protein [Actinoplanes sp. CA-142083]|uniref:ROK family protein n=1 Tax=Actinoplanes sp. CA-142083 TaxID=3239903 RepID=UPI003D8C96D7
MTTRSTELLRVAHTRPGVTRADAARLLGVGTGAATEIVARLAQQSLLAEAPAAPSGNRGRPTTVLVPHPAGPLVLAVAITHETWRIDVVELGGKILAAATGPHAGAEWASVTAAVTAAVVSFQHTYGERLRAMGVSVPGTVSPALRLTASNLAWNDVDLTALWPGPVLAAGNNATSGAARPGPILAATLAAIRPGLAGKDATPAASRPSPVLAAGNDATLAATAESHRGAAVDATVHLHLRIEGGLGGAVVDHGRALLGARGAGGEFGHMPFGDPAIACPCGAAGCWGTAVDGTALARLLGMPAPRDPVTYARRVIAAPDPESRAAVRAVAAALGRGMAGLVNALDADLVTLGGIGVDLLAAAPEEIDAAYRAGLMQVHRAAPPPVVPAALGDDGPIAGAAEEAWSRLLPELA